MPHEPPRELRDEYALGTNKVKPGMRSPSLPQAGLVLILCLGIIQISINPSLQKFALIFLYVSLFLLFWLKDSEPQFLISSVCFVFIIEANMGLSLSTVKGISLLNFVLFFPLGYVVIRNIREGKSLFAKSPLNGLLLVLVLYSFVSMMLTYAYGKYPLGAAPASNVALPNLSGSFSEILAEFKRFINPFLFFLVAYNLPRARRQAKTLGHFLIAFFLLAVLLNILAYYGLFEFISYRPPRGLTSEATIAGAYQPGFRLRGILKEPNIFAIFLVLFMPLLMASVIYHKKLLPKLLFLFSLFFSLVVLVLTGSRGGYVGLLASILVFLILSRKNNLIRSGHVFILLLCVLVLLLLVSLLYREAFMINVVQRLSFIRTGQLDPASQGRLDLWRAGIRDFLSRPIWGKGWMNSQMVHNNFLFYLATLGLFGFGIYLVLYVKIVLILIRRPDDRNFGFENFFVMSFLSGFAGFLAAKFFVEAGVSEYFLFLYLGIVLNILRFESENDSHDPGRGYSE